MAFFDWNSDFDTGIALIDSQHRKLIDLINALHEAMLHRKGKEIIGDILRETVEYSKYHFSTEEKAFAVNRYPDTPDHVKSHDGFRETAAKLLKDFGEGSLSVTIDTLDFLADWVKNHILAEDKRYVPFLKDAAIER
jgi:hemerythrin-like metal-binding protein